MTDLIAHTDPRSSPGPASAAITLRSDIDVELVKHSASDADVLWAARVSTRGARSLQDVDADPSQSQGLINYLMRERHGSPFEHSVFTFYVNAPLFVWREHQRHRIASYNEESGRYRTLEPVFYVPGTQRSLTQSGRPGAYEFGPGTPEQHELVYAQLTSRAASCYGAYQRMLAGGIAREVAREVLPLSIYSAAYVTINARSLMNFLSLRTAHPDAAFPSHPQREIEMVAERYEAIFAALMPQTHRAFTTNRRVAP